MSRAILVCFHKYTNYGGQYYEPILDFFLASMKKFADEYDKIYFIDSNWEIGKSLGDIRILNEVKGEIIRVNPSLRYFDAYKEVLPQIEEDLVLFMDNDTLVYKPNKIAQTFSLLKYYPYDVVSIYDTIGEKTFPELNGKSKFCPYWFATRKELLIKYLDIDWGPNMPEYETLGKLTQKMLEDRVRPYEWPEDKSSIYIDGTKTDEKGKDLGYYHIRAGSVPAVLLAWRKHDYEKFFEYIKTSPQREYLRQIMWYWYMTVVKGSVSSEMLLKITDMLIDIGIEAENWENYKDKFIKYHGL